MADEDAKTGSIAPSETGRSRIRPSTIFLLASTIGAGVFLFWNLQAPAPDAAVVAVQGCSSACRENLALSVGYVLESQGFRVIDAHGEDASDLDALDAIGATQHAAHRVFLRLDSPTTYGDTTITPVTMQVRSQSGLDHEVSLDVATHAVVDGPPPDDAPRRDTDATLVEAGLAALDTLGPAILGALMETDEVAAYVESEPTGSMTVVGAHAVMSLAVESARARAENVRDFEEGCAEVGREYAGTNDESLGVRCFTQGCDEDHLVGFRRGALVVQSEGHVPSFAFGERHDVARAPSPEEITLLDPETGERTRQARARRFFGYAFSDREVLSFVTATEESFSIQRWTPDERTTLRTVARPALLSHAEVRGDWVVYEARPFPGGDPQVMAIHADVETPFEVTDFGVQATWIDVGRGADRESLIAVVVAGIDPNMLEAIEAQQAPERRGEVEGIDDLEVDLDDVTRARLSAGLPPRNHIALLRLRAPDGASPQAELLHRIGGWSEDLSFVQATPSGDLVFMKASMNGCSAARMSADLIFEDPTNGTAGEDTAPGEEPEPERRDLSDALEWVSLPLCPDFPVMSDDYIYGTAVVTKDGDPFDEDAEVVRIDYAGNLVQLTENRTPERFVRLQQTAEGVRVAFERAPPPRYAAFRPSGVCEFIDSAP